MSNATVRARLSDGLFPSEVAAIIEDIDGQQIGFIASADLVVDRHNGSGRVTVRVLEKRGGHALIEVPGDVYGAVRYAVVPLSSLSSEQPG